MPHVTFIHGIANKPSKDTLLANWEAALTNGGLDLGASGIGSSMAYWAHIMYAAPAAEEEYENAESNLGTDSDDEDLSWINSLSETERKFVESLRNRLRFDEPSPDGDDFQNEMGEDEPIVSEGELNFEAIPLPWFIKRRVMKKLLKDVHHYLFNQEFSPRPGESYRVRNHIRSLFVEQLKEDSAKNNGGPHVIVSHSMGTVIAYDCLKNVPDCPHIDALMTVGSPLGLSEVQDNLDNFSKNDGYPSSRLKNNWVNIYDRLDPVALDTRIAGDYKKSGDKIITDDRVKNDGWWRHSSWKYFSQPTLCAHLKSMLRL